MPIEIKPRIIEEPSTLNALVDDLRKAQVVAVDTESNSLFAYYEKVCLIQITVRPDKMHTEKHDYIVDPFAVDVVPLGEIFADPSIEIVFHAAEYDIMCMKRDFGFEFVNIFDTYIAARTLGWPRVGLGSLLDEFFDVSVDKRFQQADWSTRPLSEKQLRYAQKDTHFLLDLRDILYNDLIEAGYFEEARESFDEVTQVDAAQERSFDPDGFWRIRAARGLEGQELAVLRELYLWREQAAERRDQPPFKIMRNGVMVDIAVRMPEDAGELQSIKGVSKQTVNRYGRDILQVIGEGRRNPVPRPPRSSMPPDADILARFDALHQWRKEKALARGVESDVILTKSALWALARQTPRTLGELENIQEIGSYRRQKYAAELLEVLASVE